MGTLGEPTSMPLLTRLNTSSCCWKLVALAAGMLKLPVVLGGTVRLGGGCSGGQLGQGGALHLLHAVVPTVVMKVNLYGSNPACLHLQVRDTCTSGCCRRYLLADWWPHSHCNRHTEDARLEQEVAATKSAPWAVHLCVAVGHVTN